MRYLKPDITSLQTTTTRKEDNIIEAVPFLIDKLLMSLKLYLNGFKIQFRIEKQP